MILNRSELALLGGLVELLEVFNVFTKFMQGQEYATMNTLALFYSEIRDNLNKMKIFSVDHVILKAVDILTEGLEKRLPIDNDMIASALLDPRMHSLPIIKEWLDSTGMIDPLISILYMIEHVCCIRIGICICICICRLILM